jgi:predicted protein tyrosine phosphatase
LNILFICSRNQWRSRTAETIFNNHAEHDVRSAGTAKNARIRVNEKMILWADLIFVMEKHHREIIKENFGMVSIDKQIVVLDIPDDYEYMDHELIQMLKSATASYF